VTGNQLGVAITLLEQDGFSVGEVIRVEREAPANEVLEQDPAASPPADQASEDCAFVTFFCSKPKVTLTVSSGPGSAKVPSVAGQDEEAATRKLEAAGFEVDVERVNSDAVEAGTVVRSEPRGGTTATKGSTVTLFVSRGPKLVKVPVVVGAQRETAVQRLRSHGLEASVSEVESPEPKGRVIRQSPDAGSRVEPGSTVAIVVSRGEKEEGAKVPNVIGKERRQAVEEIRAAGLTPNVEEEETPVQGKIGRVIDQFPPPGEELEPGATVTITVGRPVVTAAEEEGEEE